MNWFWTKECELGKKNTRLDSQPLSQTDGYESRRDKRGFRHLEEQTEKWLTEYDWQLDSSIDNLKGQLDFFIKVFHQMKMLFYLPFLSSQLVPLYSGGQRHL